MFGINLVVPIALNYFGSPCSGFLGTFGKSVKTHHTCLSFDFFCKKDLVLLPDGIISSRLFGYINLLLDFYNILWLGLLDKHSIAKGKEAVAFSFCYLVCPQDGFPAGKGTDQHQQGRLGEVKIGDHGIHYLKFVTRQDK